MDLIWRLTFNQKSLVVLCGFAFALGIFEASAIVVPYKPPAIRAVYEVRQAEFSCAVMPMGEVMFCDP